ncbi:twin transmembrane helix small protein [Roseicyclus sp.]|uniref:twin transmembrane helix small protein n=1 Tax=Roseicyclus sp. TaxID=1914329 RepID=UPI003FA1552D
MLMNDPLMIVALLACLVVLVILLMGINSFRRGGEYARQNSNKFMRWRLIAQFVAVVLILAFVFFRRQTGG